MKVIAFVGDSGSGKTTLIEGLIGYFAAAGLRVAAIKHAHEGFDMDRPGKDSYRFRGAGAAQVLVASAQRWALLSEELPGARDPAAELARQLARLDPCDLVLVEGFRGQPGVDYIEVRRRRDPAAGATRPPRAPLAGALAVATDLPMTEGAADDTQRLDLNDVPAIARYIARRLHLPPC